MDFEKELQALEQDYKLIDAVFMYRECGCEMCQEYLVGAATGYFKHISTNDLKKMVDDFLKVKTFIKEGLELINGLR